MLIDGIRFACNTCIRGHRAAQCQHNDRPLHHVRGKGRPVSQCGHCRSLRQTQSVHTMCKCALLSRTSSDKQVRAARCLCIHGEVCNCASNQPNKEPGVVSKAVQQSSNPSTISSQVQLAADQSSLYSFQPGGLNSSQAPESGVTNYVLFSQQFNEPTDWHLNDVIGSFPPLVVPPLVGNYTTATASFENGDSVFEGNTFPVLDETMFSFEDWTFDYSQPVIDSSITDNAELVSFEVQSGIDDSYEDVSITYGPV